MKKSAQLPYSHYVKDKFKLSGEEFRSLISGKLAPETCKEKKIVIGREGIQTPYDWWLFLEKNTFGALDANYLAMAFGGLKIGQIREILEETKKRKPGFFNRAYPEMLKMVNDMQNKNMCTGVISASNYIALAYALNQNGYKVPLHQVHGTDFYVKHPESGKHVLFADIVNAEYLNEHPHATIMEVIEAYKDVEVVGLNDQIQGGQEGKGAAANAIADRHVLHYNRSYPRSPIERSDMRLIGSFGDSNHPRSDIPGQESAQGGGDQGMLRTLVRGEYFALVNIDRGEGKRQADGSIAVSYPEKSRKKIEDYNKLILDYLLVEYGAKIDDVDQAGIDRARQRFPELNHFYPVRQGAISRGDGMGTFRR